MKGIHIPYSTQYFIDIFLNESSLVAYQGSMLSQYSCPCIAETKLHNHRMSNSYTDAHPKTHCLKLHTNICVMISCKSSMRS